MNYAQGAMVALSGIMLAAVAPALRAQAQAKAAITFDEFLGMDRISEAEISPDGKWVAYRVGTPDKAANRVPSHVWLAPAAGGEARQLTRSGRDSQPRWSPDGKRIAFLSGRGGTPQIYVIPTEGGEATQLTSLATGADNLQWSPDGKWLAFTSEVYPDCGDDACNQKRDAEREKSPVKARVYDALLYRHWDVWEDGKRSHLFVVSAEGGAPRDLTPTWNADVPPVQRGGAEDIAWSPDSKELCFTAVTDPIEATSTNGDLFVVPAAGGAPKRITTNPGFDAGPVYAPDGRTIAYRAQLRAGFEADKWRLMLMDRSTGRHTNLNEAFDRSVEGLVWSPDSRTLYFTAEHHGRKPLYAVEARAGAEPKAIVPDAFAGSVTLSRDGRTLAFTQMSMAMPNEIFVAGKDGSDVRQVTRHNAARLGALALSPAEHFWFEGAGRTRVHGMLVRPPGFDPAKKYPLVMILHGGPQTQFGDAWSYRWNTQMFAAPGNVVVCINRRGSTGFGQKFTDEVSQDYGGKAYEDLMRGLEHVVAKYAFVDGNRVAAAGGSYGGFMANWLAMHAKGRFRALITHASIYEQVSMFGATEELWFMEWDQGGTPWMNPEGYRRWSPATYAAELGKYKTPTLVLHGEQDYRVPYTQGLQMFTALQRQGVASRLVLFPDEGHWILKPQNSELWYREVLGWLEKHLK